MRLFRSVIFLVFTLLAGVVCAQSSNPDARTGLLVGAWVSQATRADGLTIEASMSMTRDGRFSGRATANGRAFMSYEGTWKLMGSRLNWNYLKSTPELPEAARVDSDELISVDEKVMVLRSGQGGESRTYQRQK